MGKVFIVFYFQGKTLLVLTYWRSSEGASCLIGDTESLQNKLNQPQVKQSKYNNDTEQRYAQTSNMKPKSTKKQSLQEIQPKSLLKIKNIWRWNDGITPSQSAHVPGTEVKKMSQISSLAGEGAGYGLAVLRLWKCSPVPVSQRWLFFPPEHMSVTSVNISWYYFYAFQLKNFNEQARVFRGDHKPQACPFLCFTDHCFTIYQYVLIAM